MTIYIMEDIVRKYGNCLATNDQRNAAMRDFRKEKKELEERLIAEMIKNNIDILKIGDRELTLVRKLSAKKAKKKKATPSK